MDENPLKDDILEYWNHLDRRDTRNRRRLIEATAKKFHLPSSVIEKEIADWEAGKS